MTPWQFAMIVIDLVCVFFIATGLVSLVKTRGRIQDAQLYSIARDAIANSNGNGEFVRRRILDQLDVKKTLPIAAHSDYIIAHRVWWAKVNSDGSATLISYARQQCAWPPGEALVVDGGLDSRIIPAARMAGPLRDLYGTLRELSTGLTGIHAYKTRGYALGHCGFGTVNGDRTAVFGTVALWGTVIEHEDGYRAEKAYPLTVWCPNSELANSLRRTYGCVTKVGARPYA